MQAIRKSQLVWIVVTNGAVLAGAYIPFPDQPDLRGKWITGVESLTDDALAFTPDGTPVKNYNDQVQMMLTLFDGSVQRHKDYPVMLLDPTLNFGIWKSFEPFQVNWQRSGVRVMAGLSANLLSIPFMFHYLDE